MARGMRSYKIPRGMYTGPYNALPFSSTVYTVTDNSLVPEEEINAGNYSVFQPFFLPKGVTSEAIYVEGEDIVNKWLKINGRPNTNRYGRMATWAYVALQSGFNLGYVNMRPKDATYPNTYLSLVFKQAYNKQANSDELDLSSPKKSKVYFYKDATASAAEKQGWYFDVDKEKLKAQLLENGITMVDGDVKEAEVDTYNFGFENKYLEGLTIDGSFEGELLTEANTTGAETTWNGSVVQGNVHRIFTEKQILDKKNEGDGMSRKAAVKALLDGIDTLAKLPKIDYPLFGLAYRGSGTYGNRYYMTISAKEDKLNDRYTYYHANVRENDIDVEHGFAFTLFPYSIGGRFNYNFRDRAINSCQVVFTDTNVVQTFSPFLIQKKHSLELEYVVAKCMDLVKAKVKEAMTAVEGTLLADVEGPAAVEASKARFEDFMKGYETTKELFSKPAFGHDDVDETPLSLGNITELVKFRRNEMGQLEDVTKPIPGIELLACPKRLEFNGGTFGSLQDALDAGDFDINETITYKPKGAAEAIKNYKIWIELLHEVYTGKADRAIYDPAIIRDCIVFGDNYPHKLQETIAELVRYRETTPHYLGSRPDWTYIRTPEVDGPSAVTDIAGAIAWSKTFNDVEKNFNMHPIIGSWVFNDPTTGGQNRFCGFFEYLGKGGSLYNYLTSQSASSFASGDYSKILSAAPGTGWAIPEDDDEQSKKDLVAACIMFYSLRSDGYYALAEDLGYLPKMKSAMKNIGSCIHFNRIGNIAHNYLRDNQIIDNERDVLERLKTAIETRIKEPAKHFKGRVQVKIEISQHENEQVNKVALATIDCTGHDYIRHNRLNVVMNSPVGNK